MTLTEKILTIGMIIMASVILMKVLPRPAEECDICIYQDGKVVFELDKPYEVEEGYLLMIDEMLQKEEPDWQKVFVYKGKKFQADSIRQSIGWMVDEEGGRGPVYRGVTFVLVGRGEK